MYPTVDSGLTITTLCHVSDSKRTCGVVTNPPIRGQNVQLSCILTYRIVNDHRQRTTGAALQRSISWDSVAGTLLSRPWPWIHATNSDGDVVGETLQTDVMTLASGDVIPPYNCTLSLAFYEGWSLYYTFAFNNASWTCVSEPVSTWCMYFSPIFSYF